MRNNCIAYFDFILLDVTKMWALYLAQSTARNCFDNDNFSTFNTSKNILISISCVVIYSFTQCKQNITYEPKERVTDGINFLNVVPQSLSLISFLNFMQNNETKPLAYTGLYCLQLFQHILNKEFLALLYKASDASSNLLPENLRANYVYPSVLLLASIFATQKLSTLEDTQNAPMLCVYLLTHAITIAFTYAQNASNFDQIERNFISAQLNTY